MFWVKPTFCYVFSAFYALIDRLQPFHKNRNWILPNPSINRIDFHSLSIYLHLLWIKKFSCGQNIVLLPKKNCNIFERKIWNYHWLLWNCECTKSKICAVYTKKPLFGLHFKHVVLYSLKYVHQKSFCKYVRSIMNRRAVGTQMCTSEILMLHCAYVKPNRSESKGNKSISFPASACFFSNQIRCHSIAVYEEKKATWTPHNSHAISLYLWHFGN